MPGNEMNLLRMLCGGAADDTEIDKEKPLPGVVHATAF